MTTTFCDSSHVKLKAGTNVSSAITFADYEQLINEAEDALNVAAISASGVDLITDYAAMSDNFKLVLQDGASSHAAVGAINFDIDAIGRGTANLAMNVNWTRWKDAEKKVKEADELTRVRRT